MAISNDQKVDLLYKQAFGVTKTDTFGNKSPSNEAIISIPVVRGNEIWADSGDIPVDPTIVALPTAAVTAVIVHECIADATANPVGGVSPTWLSNLKDWIPPTFGAKYGVKVYVNNPGVVGDPSIGGTQIFPDGAGGTGEFFFNYSSGVLHFMGSALPSSLTTAKHVYVVGYRYKGVKGVAGSGGSGGGSNQATDIQLLPPVAGTTNVQTALETLNTGLTGKVNRSGDTMTGALLLQSDPTEPLQAATKSYVDGLDLTNVKKVNGVLPTNGNVELNFVGTQTGPALPAGAPTPIGGQTDGVVFIISGAPVPPPPGEDPNGQAFIWSDSESAWLEISPPGTATNDARYLRLAGGTLTGSLLLAADPTNVFGAATKGYVDDNFLPLAGGSIKDGGQILLPLLRTDENPQQVVTKAYVDFAVAAGGGGGGGSNQATDILLNPAVAGTTNVQTALETLNTGLTNKLSKLGDSMAVGAFLSMSSDPTDPLHAATKSYVDTLDAENVKSVNGVTPTNGNVPLSLGTTLTGTIDDRDTLNTPPTQGDGTVWIVSGEVPPLDVNNGQAFIWSDAATDWLEISPPGTASSDARYLKLDGNNGPMTGLFELSADPTAPLHAATKGYVDDNFLPLAGGSITGQILLPAVPINANAQQAVTKAYVDDAIAGVGGGAGGGGGNATSITFQPTGNITSTNVQNAIVELDGETVKRGGDTMTGFLTLNAAPTANLHAATKQYVDGLGSTVDSLALAVQTIDNTAVFSVNGITPVNGNVGVNIVGTITGDLAYLAAQNPPDPLTPGGSIDGIVFIVSGETVPPPPAEDPNGQAFIWSTAANDWLEISPPGIASTDARYLKLTGGELQGNLSLATDVVLTLSGDPVNNLEAATKKYVDDTVSGAEFLPLTGGNLTGFLTLNAAPTDDLHAATRKFVIDAVAAGGGGGGGGGPTTGDLVDITATGTIPNTTVQGAIAQLEANKVAKAGDSMTGPLTLNADPVVALHAAPKQYVDGKFALSPATTAADSGNAPILDAAGKLNSSTTPIDVPLTVNGVGVTPGTQNIAVNIVGTQTGQTLPTGAPTPIGGQTDGVVFIISGLPVPPPPAEDPNGQAFIWSDAAAAWLEISPPGIASTDARYLKLSGGTLAGSLTMDTGAGLYLSDDPAAPLEAATKQYVDSKAGGTADLIPLNLTPNIGAVTLQSTSNVFFSIDEMNKILGKLVPPAPAAFPGGTTLSIASTTAARMCATVPNNTGPNAVAAGATVATLRAAPYTTNNVTGGPGDSGIVSVRKNGAVSGTKTLTTGNDTGTYTDLRITANPNVDAFYSTITASGAGTGVAGWNTVAIEHTGATNTNIASWYYDTSTPGAPVLTQASFAPNASATTSFSSTIPHYTAGSVFDIGVNAGKLSGDTYPTSDTFLTGAAGGAFGAPASRTYAQVPAITTPLVVNAYAATTVLCTTTAALSGSGSSNQGPTVTATNGYGQTPVNINSTNIILYRDPAVGINENSITVTAVGTGTGAASRIVLVGNTDAPAFAPSAVAFNSQSSTLETYDATVVGGVLRHDVTNYSTGYIPVGPNLTNSASTQYFTFKFIRTQVSKFDISYSGTLAGLWVALPGSTIVTTLNNWMDASVAYAGVGVPGTGTNGNNSNGCALGGPAVLNSLQTNKSVTATFGTLSSSNTTTNEIYVRVKLITGQSITALSLKTASN